MQYSINPHSIYQADRYTFTDTQSKSLQIVFIPQMLQGTRRIPQLDYQSSEGKFTFQGDEIVQQQSNLGLLISVPLKTNTDEGFDFALILPFFDMNGQKRQEFETVAIAATKNQKIVTNCTKYEFTYKMLTLKAVAEKLSVVASGSVSSSNWFKNRRSSSTAWQGDGYDLIDFNRF